MMRSTVTTGRGAKPPTVKARRLAAELRRLRGDMTREEVEKATGVNEGTLYRLETARAKPQRRTLVALLDLYGVTGALRNDLIEIARTADGQGWLRPYHSQLPEEYAAYISFEAEAHAVRNYESLFIPGLLQTADYARAVITGTLPMASSTEVDQRVQARLERQELLRGGSLDLWAIVDEAALRRLVGGPSIMDAQLAYLVEASARHNVTLQVIPFEAGAHPGMPGSFVYMNFPEPGDPELIYVDTLAGDLFLEADADLRRYASLFDHLRASALSPVQTTDMISTVRRELEVGRDGST